MVNCIVDVICDSMRMIVMPHFTSGLHSKPFYSPMLFWDTICVFGTTKLLPSALLGSLKQPIENYVKSVFCLRIPSPLVIEV